MSGCFHFWAVRALPPLSLTYYTKILGSLPTRWEWDDLYPERKSCCAWLLYVHLFCVAKALRLAFTLRLVATRKQDVHRLVLVLPVRPRHLRLLPLDLRLRQVEVVRVPFLVVVQISRAEGEEGAGQGRAVALADSVSSARVRRAHHDLLPHAPPRAPPVEQRGRQ